MHVRWSSGAGRGELIAKTATSTVQIQTCPLLCMFDWVVSFFRWLNYLRKPFFAHAVAKPKRNSTRIFSFPSFSKLKAAILRPELLALDAKIAF